MEIYICKKGWEFKVNHCRYWQGLQWQLAVANECDGWRAGAAEESPLHTITGTGVWNCNYNGKPGRQPNNS